MPPGSTARPPPPAAETVANHGAENSSREYAQPAAGWCRSGSQNPARSSRCDRLAVGHAAVRTAPSPNSDRVAAPTAARKTAARASFVCPYKSPQKLAFISARKCWKCSLIGIIFAIGCRSPFQERLSLVRQSQLTPSRLLHNQRYVTHKPVVVQLNFQTAPLPISPAEHELFEGVLFSFVLRVLYAVAAQAATTCLRKPQC